MPHFVISGYLPKDFDPSTVDEAMVEGIHALNREMDAAGITKISGGLGASRTVRAQTNGDVIVTDGPYLEAKEFVGGMMIIEVADLDEALAWARKSAKCTHMPSEVRELFFVPDPAKRRRPRSSPPQQVLINRRAAATSYRARRNPMPKNILCPLVLIACAVFAGPFAHRTAAQAPTSAYAKMAAVEQYLMDRDAEITLARSAAPDAISHDARVLVLTRHGYETAVQGKTEWVCLVDRGFSGMFDNADFWNPKIRAAGCLNPSAARSFLPYDLTRSKLILEGRSKEEIIAATQVAIEKKELPMLEPGAMCYMMSKTSYLYDQGDHTMSHVMFYTADDGTAWGANLAHSPIMGVNYWTAAPDAYPQLKGFPRIFVSLIAAAAWSDGTPAMPM